MTTAASILEGLAERRGPDAPAPAATIPAARATPRASHIPADLDLTLQSRRPAKLQEATARAAANLPTPVAGNSRHTSQHTSPPAASVVVVTYNNLPFTKLCLSSLFENTPAGDYELFVVDNASTDGTADFLRSLEAANPHAHAILNETNRGFAAANNQALAVARGRVIVLLNNDTVVPPGWLATLTRHLDDPSVGLVGPVTNRIGNEAEVETDYRTYGGLLRAAESRAREFRGRSFDIPVPCMFCLALRRDAYETIGPLDERFEVGLLEDDDYARRAHAAGYRTVCADDVLVHHFGQASFGSLVPTGEYGRILAANQKRFEDKWGEPWKPYGRRVAPSYARLVDRLRQTVRELLPRGATVAVVSRGDEELVSLDGATGWHFPRSDDGAYAGHYPADGAEAVAQLERVRRGGAEYFLIPATSLWWLDHYRAFAEHLRDHYDLLWRRDDAGALYSLAEGRAGARLRDASTPVAETGSCHYRAFVGPEDKYDLVAAMQFNLLTRLGLRDHHHLLDVGCGSLRAGRLFIPYLLPGRYFGIEPEAWLVREGLERELGRDAERVKSPAFSHDRDFTLTTFGRPFDYVVAQSIFSHAAPGQIERCLSEAAKVLKPRGVFAATFFEGEADYDGHDWVYPGCVLYTLAGMKRMAAGQGLECRRIDWPHPNGQKWLAFVRPGVEPNGAGLLSDDSAVGGEA
jgi:GT2 family glycosyltransferase/SAM-dependent methyltransferase